ncbi:Meiosis-specific protein HOP1 [Candida tropicalis]
MGVTAEESRGFVYELISTSMYCITYLRNLFRETSYYDTKYFDTVDPDLTSSYICVKKLRKGASKSSDIFVEYIERGIFQAIQLKYLKGVSFNIHSSKNSPFNSEESYLFGIDYINNQVSLNGSNEEISSDSITKSIYSLVKRLIVLTQTLETPRKQRYFTIRLLYNETCPSEYQPPYFQDATLLEPNVIRLEADSQGIAIGTLQTGECKSSINVLVEKRNSNTCVDVDPFDLLADDYNGFDDSPLSTLHLSEKSPEAVEVTQILEPSRLVKCKICENEIDPVALGYDQPLVRDIPCFECLFKGNIDPELIILQKVRILWNFYMNHDFPSFKKSLDIIKITDPETIKKIFNRLFNDGILVTTNKATLATNSAEFQKGSGIFSSTLEGIIDNHGCELIANREYFVSFVPKLSEKLNFLDFDTKLRKIYFPNYKILKLAFVMSNLNKFKKTNPIFHKEHGNDDVVVPVTAYMHSRVLNNSQTQSSESSFSPTSDYVSRSSIKFTFTNKETSPTTAHSEDDDDDDNDDNQNINLKDSSYDASEISHNLDDLSFAESLQLLSQQSVISNQQSPIELTQVMNKTRKAESNVYYKKKKRRKVSINKKI